MQLDDDLLAGARAMLRPNVHKGEEVAIIGSTDVDLAAYMALVRACEELGVEATVGLMTPRRAYGRPAPAALQAQILAADFSLLVTSTSLGHTDVLITALRQGRRLITSPLPRGEGRAAAMLTSFRSFSPERLAEIKRASLAVARVLSGGSRVWIASPQGTGLHVDITGQNGCPYYGLVDPDGNNKGSWPPGEAHIATVAGTAEGVLVVDGYVGGVGIPKPPMRIEFTRGRIASISGGLAREFGDVLDSSDENARELCEVGIGTSVYQKLAGTNGDKKMSGTVHVAVGGNYSSSFGGPNPTGTIKSNVHIDLHLRAPVECRVDGTLLVSNGRVLVEEASPAASGTPT